MEANSLPSEQLNLIMGMQCVARDLDFDREEIQEDGFRIST